MKIGMAAELRQMDAQAEEKYGLPALLLMENAGRRAAACLAELLDGVQGKYLCVFAGSGNNGGDALAAARHLAGMGADVHIFLVGDQAHFSAATTVMYHAVEQMALPVHTLAEDRDWHRLHLALRLMAGGLDGLLGTGVRGELRKQTLRLIEEINGAGKPVLAIDLPSGVEADTGRVSTVAIEAAATLALALPKPCHYLSPGADYTGRLLVDSIGLPPALLTAKKLHQTLLDDALAATLLPPRPRAAHKGTCGRILVVAGSCGMTGAAKLAAQAVLRAGAGLVTLAVPESQQPVVAARLTEGLPVPVPESQAGCMGGQAALDQLVQLAAGYDAVLIGPGLGRAYETGELVRGLVAQVEQPVIIDADGLYAFTGQADALQACQQLPILTPHLGELARLLGTTVTELRTDLVAQVRAAAARLQCVLVAKSECTLVAYPDGDVFFTSKGNAGMATAGCGDVLAGTIAGLMEQTEEGVAPLLGVWLHGTAGDLAYAARGEGLVAGDILTQLPQALQQLRQLQLK